MSQDSEFKLHFVCTEKEARVLLSQAERIIVAECGCRQERDCQRSHSELCLWFVESGMRSPRAITRAEAEQVLDYGKEKGLIFRPFRSATDKTVVEGLCLCCDCCCSYFRGLEASDKGQLVESTDLDSCTHCGLCVPVCFYKARSIAEGSLTITSEACYGCGVCVGACPLGSITMEEREDKDK